MRRFSLGLVALLALGKADGNSDLKNLHRVTRVSISQPPSLAGDLSLEEFADENVGAATFRDYIEGKVYLFEQKPNSCLLDNMKPYTPPETPWIALVDTHEHCFDMLGELALEFQEIGAHALIMESHHCLCDSPILTTDSKCSSDQDECGPIKPYGTPQDIPELSIPVLTISREKSRLMADCINDENTTGVAQHTTSCSVNEERPNIRISWSMKKKLTPLMKIVFSAGGSYNEFLSSEFSDQVLPSIEGLAEITIIPAVFDKAHAYVNYKATYVECTDLPEDSVFKVDCDEQCTENGKFCHETAGGVDGRLIVLENERQACLWEVVGEDKASWFKYASLVNSECLSEENLTSACSEQVHLTLGLDFSQTSSCVASKGHTLLQKHRSSVQAFREAHIVEFPALIIDNTLVPYGHRWANILSALCASFPDDEGNTSFCDTLCLQMTSEDRFDTDEAILECVVESVSDSSYGSSTDEEDTGGGSSGEDGPEGGSNGDNDGNAGGSGDGNDSDSGGASGSDGEADGDDVNDGNDGDSGDAGGSDGDADGDDGDSGDAGGSDGDTTDRDNGDESAEGDGDDDDDDVPEPDEHADDEALIFYGVALGGSIAVFFLLFALLRNRDSDPHFHEFDENRHNSDDLGPRTPRLPPKVELARMTTEEEEHRDNGFFDKIQPSDAADSTMVDVGISSTSHYSSTNAASSSSSGNNDNNVVLPKTSRDTVTIS